MSIPLNDQETTSSTSNSFNTQLLNESIENIVTQLFLQPPSTQNSSAQNSNRNSESNSPLNPSFDQFITLINSNISNEPIIIHIIQYLSKSYLNEDEPDEKRSLILKLLTLIFNQFSMCKSTLVKIYSSSNIKIPKQNKNDQLVSVSYYNYLSKILTVLQNLMMNCSYNFAKIISKSFSELVTSILPVESDNFYINSLDKVTKKYFETLQGFCFYNMNLENKENRLIGSLCLEKLVENCPIVLNKKYMKIIWDNIMHFLGIKNYISKSELLNCLITLILGSENDFHIYANATLYKIIEFLTDNDWIIRKLSLNIIYSLLYYCKEDIIKLKDNLIDFIKLLKYDKNKDVRDMCLLILDKLNYNDNDKDISINEKVKSSKGIFVHQKNTKNTISDNLINLHKLDRKKILNQENEYMHFNTLTNHKEDIDCIEDINCILNNKSLIENKNYANKSIELFSNKIKDANTQDDNLLTKEYKNGITNDARNKSLNKKINLSKNKTKNLNVITNKKENKTNLVINSNINLNTNIKYENNFLDTCPNDFFKSPNITDNEYNTIQQQLTPNRTVNRKINLKKSNTKNHNQVLNIRNILIDQLNSDDKQNFINTEHNVSTNENVIKKKFTPNKINRKNNVSRKKDGTFVNEKMIIRIDPKKSSFYNIPKSQLYMKINKNILKDNYCVMPLGDDNNKNIRNRNAYKDNTNEGINKSYDLIIHKTKVNKNENILEDLNTNLNKDKINNNILNEKNNIIKVKENENEINNKFYSCRCDNNYNSLNKLTSKNYTKKPTVDNDNKITESIDEYVIKHNENPPLITVNNLNYTNLLSLMNTLSKKQYDLLSSIDTIQNKTKQAVNIINSKITNLQNDLHYVKTDFNEIKSKNKYYIDINFEFCNALSDNQKLIEIISKLSLEELEKINATYLENALVKLSVDLCEGNFVKNILSFYKSCFLFLKLNLKNQSIDTIINALNRCKDDENKFNKIDNNDLIDISILLKHIKDKIN